MNTTQTLTATTARDITFGAGDGYTYRAPAGTTVYVTEKRNGTLRARIPGTLYVQDVNAASIIPA